jgi:HNH endonuclease
MVADILNPVALMTVFLSAIAMISKCLKCSNDFRHPPSRIRKYCSKICYSKADRSRAVRFECLHCGIEFKRPLYYVGIFVSKYCSRICRVKANRVPKNEQQIMNIMMKSYEKFVIRNEDGCWDWSGSKNKYGYGRVASGRSKDIGIHRAAWIIHNGEIPNGLWVLHHCDNRLCSRLDHLYLGNAQQNSLDAKNRNRFNPQRGEMSPNSKLTEEMVRKIRCMIHKKITLRLIAKEFDIAEGIISKINTGKTWNHVKSCDCGE